MRNILGLAIASLLVISTANATPRDTSLDATAPGHNDVTYTTGNPHDDGEHGNPHTDSNPTGNPHSVATVSEPAGYALLLPALLMVGLVRKRQIG